MNTIKDNQELNNYIYLKQGREFKEERVPIYKGCSNKQCFCTGACREIIGYRDKTQLEKLNEIPR